VVNAYMLTFGGFLLLSGRLGDLFGNKRVFLGGVVLFTAASIACGLAPNSLILVVGRAVQGLGGAAVSAVALALIMGLFTDPAERAKAMGFFGFVVSGGGAVGVLAGGVLTGLLNWHWIFLVNVPIGVGVWLAAGRVLPADEVHDDGQHLDVPGAGLVTLSLMIAVYGVVGGNEAGWTSFQTLGLLAAAAVLMVAFLVREARVEHPLVPLRLFKLRNVAISQIVGVLWAGAMFAWFFLSALYLQLVLGYSPLEVGLAFFPGSLLMGLMSLGFTDRINMRFGPRNVLITGLSFLLVAMLLFLRTPVDGNYLTDLFPTMIFFGFGAGVAFPALMMLAMSGATPQDAGLASGLVNTAGQVGGAIGLAVLATISTERTDSLLAEGKSMAEALNGGFHLAYVVGAAATAVAILTAVTVMRSQSPAAMAAAHGEPAQDEPAQGEPAYDHA
jgi:EmrB/QacA subfamily drug resistance transporter